MSIFIVGGYNELLLQKQNQLQKQKQHREVLSVQTKAAMRKLERLDYLLSSCSAPISRRVMEVIDSVVSPEDRVEAARVVLMKEQGVRDSDFVRACLGSLEHDDERELSL